MLPRVQSLTQLQAKQQQLRSWRMSCVHYGQCGMTSLDS